MALFVLGLFMNSIAGAGGAFVLTMGYARQDVTQPLWQAGQASMFMGLINLTIFVSIFFQGRKLVRITHQLAMNSTAMS